MAATPPTAGEGTMRKPTLEYIINHVFLPPQLPQEDDYSLTNESWLLFYTLEALEHFETILKQNPADDTELIAIQDAFDMIDNLDHIYTDDETLSPEKELYDSLESLSESIDAAPIPIYLHAQNAGILISSAVEDGHGDVHFELFELSPLNNDAMSVVGRLQRTFPGCAVAIPPEEFKKPAFLSTVTDTLTKMSQQPASGTAQKVRKAGEMHQEDREATHPKIVTELFSAYLRSVGRMVQVSSILKNTRQDVLWKDARSPWRRSAMWLLVRVALQLFFSRHESDWVKANTYKTYMLLFMAYILREAEEYDISADLMWSMKAKVTRRRLKLANCGNSGVLQFVDDVLSKAAANLETQWSRIQKRGLVRHNFSDLKALPAAQDTLLHLERLDKYLEAISKREDYIQQAEVRESCPLPEFKSPLNTSFDGFPQATPAIFKLLKFESWVELSLDSWLMANLGNEGICRELRFVMKSYHCCAIAQYRHNPEAMSLMFLTIMELWVALDKSTIRYCDLLKDYAPPLGEKILRSLILPERRQMERLQAIEHYLKHRSSQAEFSANYIFQDFGRDDCFAVRYFDQSEEHISTWNDIQGRAKAAAEQKRVELKEKRKEYERHMKEYNRLKHEYVRVSIHRSGKYEEIHDPSCNKCHHKTAMDSLTIGVHEWPLPEDYNEAKTIVFELCVPLSFSSWRDATTFMIIDVFGFGYASQDQPRAFYRLRSIEGLKSFAEHDATQRVSLLSEEKPHSCTHRNVKSIITTSDEEVFVSHGARFRYFDSDSGQYCFVRTFAPTNYFTHACTFQLSISSRQMQQFLDDTIDPIRFSNTVIATQSQCPRKLSLEEYKGMASIRAGGNTRWQNILKELALPSINFGKEDTAVIILQCIHQAGESSASNVLRQTHGILVDQRFCITLLGKLLDACERVFGNWQSAPALSAFISITSRMLSLSSCAAIQHSALEILSRAREVSLEWVNILKKKAQRATEDHIREDLLSQAVFVALICADSFNINSRNMREVLSIPEAAATLIQVSILIQECQHKIAIGASPLASLLYHRWKRLCFHSFPILAEQVAVNQSPALDMAIRRSWATYQPVGPWHALQAPYSHWLISTSAPGGNGNISVVQFSMLTGELLVNGLPLNRLPEEYEKSSAYRTLFGNSAIEAMPSSVIGMRFSGKQTFAEHKLHFNFGTEQDTLPEACLLIRASNLDATLELISPSLFCDQLPAAFLDEFVHWYNMTDGYIEFRPRDLAWSHSDTNWKLYRVGSGNAWQLSRVGKSLVNIQSRTAARFSNIFKALEDARYIHIMLDQAESLLDIELPRTQLGFSATLDGASINSHQHRGMSIHEDQTIGALIGLQNKLILKSDKANSRDKIIIPNGEISYSGNGNHIRVTIDRHSSTKAHVYEIDRQLGRITDNGTLTSKLFLAYIHGLTSFCLPDPLTGSTGTNAALTILRSAAVRSFPSASQADIELLVKLAKLTPGREYYPKNLQVMETVHWSPGLGFLAQHSEYYESVKSLFEYFKRSDLLLSRNLVEIPPLHDVDQALLRREKIRSSVVRVWDFGAQHYTQIYDGVYSARDRSPNSLNALRALSLSRMVFQGKPNPQFPITGDIGNRIWKFLNKYEIVNADPCSSDIFRYDATLLGDVAKVKMAEQFLSRLKALTTPNIQSDKYRVMIWLAGLAFADDSDMTILQVLACFYMCPEMNAIQIPEPRFFSLISGIRLKEDDVKEAVHQGRKNINSTPYANLERYQHETNKQYKRRKWNEFQNGTNRVVTGFVKELMGQWPCASPQAFSHSERETYIDVNKTMSAVRVLFQECHDNHRLRHYLLQLGKAVPRTSTPLDALVYMPSAPAAARKSIRSERFNWHVRGFVTTDIVFSGPAPLHIIEPEPDPLVVKSAPGRKRDITLLPDLLARLDQITDSPFEIAYMENLRDSLLALSRLAHQQEIGSSPDHLHKYLVRRRNELEQTLREVYLAIVDAVTKPIRKALYEHNEKDMPDLPLLQHFPKLCPIFFLQHLSQKRWANISEDWRRCIIHYGVALTQLQQADRLLDASKDPAYLMKELNNPGHKNWDPYQYPESLLLEIENSILIRGTQEEIAAQMRNPLSENNAVMQLNMGEGKSSVIVPIVAASLADTTRLVRVIVARPQSKQMLQMLVAKLGGLLDRQIYHLPFSRAVKIGDGSAKVVDGLLKECMEYGGILLTQPENILSLMLMGIESRISGNSRANETLVKTLGFLDANSRDIVDESDENFSVKFELLYTMGLQQSIPYSPGRWICVQDVLEIFRKIAPEIQHELPSSIEIYKQPIGGFPRIRILRADAHSRVLIRIAEEICSKGLKGFPIVRQRKKFRQAVFRYITTVQPSPADINTVEDNRAEGFWAKWRDALLLLRGLLAGGILSFCFGQKRWRVDYGLDANRRPATKLALPFRAKDNPTPRSEFSHPEVVIVLTQLSYYYGGLSNEELEASLKHLLNSDQPEVEFHLWVREATTLSSEFKQVSGINLADRSTCEENIFPHLHFSKGAIDYFLSNCVFPKEMKEFPHKLSASGWDIGKIKRHPTTGFSGTNDSRAVLPLSVEQLDLDAQNHTNALVLEHLLQPENSVALMPPRVHQEVSDAEMLLGMVVGMQPPVRVILDVGAQILELDNLGVAEKWLSSVHDSKGTEAVVFFSAHDELSVLDRKGRIEPLQVSPYINQLDHCLVFLDEAHTRGTDLKLPRHYRAAVTLGANLTKDRLVQACMRMRLLGEGQSVIFCVPEEISSQIQQRLPNVQSVGDTVISVSDILAWAITETWNETKRNIPLWATQGRRHERHKDLWAQCHAAEDSLTDELARQFLEDEAQSLEDRYRPIQTEHEFCQSDDAISRRCQQFNNIKLSAAILQEEQERELAPEIEQERQDERPPLVEPTDHALHKDVVAFVKTGTPVAKSNGYIDAFMSLRKTSAASLFNLSEFRSGLLVSADFARTVKSNATDKLDGYQRPVQWVLTASRTPDGAVEHMMIISPYEADRLVRVFNRSKLVALHLYAPCSNSAYDSLDKLDLYTVPRTLKDREIPLRLITALNLFSGQLYISSYEGYIDICKFLGLSWEPTRSGEIIEADGFIRRDRDGRVGGESGLSASPVEFFKVFLSKIRRNCEAIDKTHMGQVLGNQLLSPEEFEQGLDEVNRVSLSLMNIS